MLQLNFAEIIQRGVSNWQDGNKDAEADASDCIRGSNTPLIHEGNFVAEGHDHCPRIALMRRAKMPTSYPKTFKDLASHAYGRAMEDLIKQLIHFAGVEGLVTAEEENYKVQVQDTEGNVFYSARPDLVVFYNSVPVFPCEFKSVQSTSTGEAVFSNKTPKLGAAIQLAAQMHFHDIEKGVICYILGNWIDGYSFAKKAKFKLEPAFIHFECEFDADGWLLVDNKKTIVNRHNLQNSILMLNQLYTEGQLPVQRPKSVKLFGQDSSYGVCEYCPYGPKKTRVCERAESFQDGLFINNFKELVNEAFSV